MPQSLTFTPTPLAISIGGVLVLLILSLALVACWRARWKRSVVLLETLRVVIAGAIALTLLQPEWQQTFTPESKPTIAVLTDVSGSMETADVLDPTTPNAKATTRTASIAPLGDEATWAALAERMDVVIEPFSSAQADPSEGTDLNTALKALPDQHPNLVAVVLASDGDWNLGGSPSSAASRLRMKEVPIFAVPAGSPDALPDLAITAFEVPIFAITEKALRIPFTLTSTLPRDEPVTLSMEAPGGEIITHSVVVPAMGEIQDALLWRPGLPGEATLTLKLPELPNDAIAENNTLEAPLEIRKEQLRVLLIESLPRWEYRYLRNALERDPGVEVSCLLFHPSLNSLGAGRGYLKAFPPPAELSNYDVVFLGDVGTAQLSNAEIEALKLLVRDQASGLVFLPGLLGNQGSLQETPLEELIPVVLNQAQPRGWGTPMPGKFVLTEPGRRSLLTKLEDSDEASANTWSELPGFHWYAPALRAKVGTEVLATHGTETTPFGRVPLLVTRTFGAGKVLFMGSDGAWRWRKGVEDKYHYRFWSQVVRWMAYQRNIASGDKMRLFYSPDRPATNQPLTLNANVMSATGEPLRSGNVVAELAAPSGKVTSLRLQPAGEEAWGLFTGLFTPTEPGTYKLRLTCAESGAPLEAEIPVTGSSLEQRGRPARHEVLAELAQLTRGELLPANNIADAVAAVAALPDPEPEIRRLPLWCHPLWTATLFLLLGIFWIFRKRAGLF